MLSFYIVGSVKPFPKRAVTLEHLVSEAAIYVVQILRSI
ncbi:hypothetical protein HDF11_005350 [Tunturiibacter psychrotolerans]